MNDTNTPAANPTAASITQPVEPRPGLDEIDFYPIDRLKMHPFNHALLKLGQFLTERELVRRQITEAKLSLMMFKYCNKLHIRPFTAKEIREQLWGGSGEFTGGGVRVEWCETSSHYGRFQAHYQFTFCRIYRDEGLNENCRALNTDLTT